MIAGACRDERAVLDRPGVRVLFSLLPAVESLAVEDGLETFLALGLAQSRSGQGEQNIGAQQKRSDLHLEYLLDGAAPRVGAGIPRPTALITDAGGEYPPLRAVL